MAVLNQDESPEYVIDVFQTKLIEEGLFKFVAVELTPKNWGISFDSICSNTFGQGHASNALKILLALCDEFHKDIELIPHSLKHEKDTLSKEQLEMWYARHDFKTCNTDDGSTIMRRKYCPRCNT